jgi:trans-aconitate methyltransferase
MNPISPDEIGSNYNKIADLFEQKRSLTVGTAYADKFLQLLLPCFDRPNSCTILDIGCGTGIPLTRQLAMSGAQVVGLDISSKMIEKARGNVPNASFMMGDIVTTRFETKFDGVFAWDSLFHIPLERQEEVIRKITGWLNPNGVLLFTAGGSHGELVSEMFGKPFYYSSLSCDQYENILADENCRVIINDIDDPSSAGHRVICCRKN